MKPRYAVYFVPEPGTALAKLGSALLGRDSETGCPVSQPRFPGFMEEELRALTADARRYGLHATLKAPFFLKEGMTEPDLLLFADRFVMGRQSIVLPRLLVKRIGAFFALVLSEETPPEREASQRINTLAADTVSLFDPFRTAPSGVEIARRNPQKLSARQLKLLAKWGYPYVFDEYRFHFTLTNKLGDDAAADVVQKRLEAYFQAVCHAPLDLSSLCICKQIVPGAEFMLLQRFYFPDIPASG